MLLKHFTKLSSILLVASILLSGGSLYAQKWHELNKQEKGNQIVNQISKGNNYLGISMSFGGVAAKDLYFGHFYFDMGYGKLVADRNMAGVRVGYYGSRLMPKSDNSLYTISSKPVIEGFYRYYLPLFNSGKLPVYFETGIEAGKSYSRKEDVLAKVIKTDHFFVASMGLGAGIAIPVNKFRLEFDVKYYYQLLNRDLYFNYYNKTPFRVNIGFSYLF